MRRTKMSRDQLHEAIHGPDGWLQGPPSDFDMIAQRVGLYDVLQKFVDEAEYVEMPFPEAGDDQGLPSPGDIGIVLNQIVSDWIEAIRTRTSDVDA